MDFFSPYAIIIVGTFVLFRVVLSPFIINRPNQPQNAVAIEWFQGKLSLWVLSKALRWSRDHEEANDNDRYMHFCHYV